MRGDLAAAILGMIALILISVYGLLPWANIVGERKRAAAKRERLKPKPAAFIINDEFYRLMIKMPSVNMELEQHNNKIAGFLLNSPYVGMPVYRSPFYHGAS